MGQVQSFLYGAVSAAPSNVFILLMMEDLCSRTLTRREGRKGGLPYLLPAAAILLTAADILHNSFVTLGVTFLILMGLMLWEYRVEPPLIRGILAGVFALITSPSDLVGEGFWLLGRVYGYEGGSMLLCQALGGQVYLLLVFILMRWYIRAAVSIFHESTGSWFWLCLIVPGASLPTMLVIWRMAMTVRFSAGLELALNLCCSALLYGCLAAFMLFERIALQMEVTREYQAVRLRSEMERRHYELLQQKSDEYAAAVHDIKHHMRALRDLARQGDLSGVEGYLDALREDEAGHQREGHRIFTEDKVLNVLLSEKAARAAEKDIQFVVSLTAGLDFMDPVDAVALMGNLLDNAIEGAETTPDGEDRFIRVTIRPFNQGFVLIQVENSFLGPLRERRGRLLSTKDPGSRGYGMRSIAQIAEKAGGSMEYEAEGGRFTVTVMLGTLARAEE